MDLAKKAEELNVNYSILERDLTVIEKIKVNLTEAELAVEK